MMNNNMNNYNNGGGNYYNNNNQNHNNNRNNNQQQRQQQPQREKATLVLRENKPFDGEIKGMLISTFDLCKTVNEMFRQVFSDYEGCVILPNKFNGNLEVFLSFVDRGVESDKYKALTTLVRKDINNLTPSERLQNLNNRYKNKTYELTQDAKDILEEFIYPRGNSKKVKWEQIVTEQTQGNMYGRQTIHVIISDLQLTLLLKKIYGAKVEGSRVDYEVSIQRPLNVGMGMNNNATEFLLSIKQLDTKKVEKLFEKLGMMPQVGGMLPIVSAHNE